MKDINHTAHCTLFTFYLSHPDLLVQDAHACPFRASHFDQHLFHPLTYKAFCTTPVPVAPLCESALVDCMSNLTYSSESTLDFSSTFVNVRLSVCPACLTKVLAQHIQEYHQPPPCRLPKVCHLEHGNLASQGPGCEKVDGLTKLDSTVRVRVNSRQCNEGKESDIRGMLRYLPPNLPYMNQSLSRHLLPFSLSDG